MSATLLITLAADGGFATGPAGADPAARRVVAVPGTEVLTRPVRVPARTEAQARAAVPFLLADELGAPASTQHFALAPREEGSETRRVAIVSQARMRAWMQALAAAGIEADCMIADHAALVAAPGTAVLLDLPGHVALALGDGTSCAVEHALLPELLGRLLDQAAVERVELHSAAPDRLMPREGWGARTVIVASDDPLSALRRAIDGSAGPNLLQGAFGRRRDWRATFRTWRRVALLAAALPILFVVTVVVDIRRHDALRVAALETATEIFRRAVPDAGRVVNPRAQIDAALAAAEAHSGGDFLTLADALFGSLAGVEGAALNSMRFEAARGVLAAEIAHGQHDDLEHLSRLATAGGAVLVKGSSRSTPGGIISDVTLEMRR